MTAPSDFITTWIYQQSVQTNTEPNTENGLVGIQLKHSLILYCNVTRFKVNDPHFTQTANYMAVHFMVPAMKLTICASLKQFT